MADLTKEEIAVAFAVDLDHGMQCDPCGRLHRGDRPMFFASKGEIFDAGRNCTFRDVSSYYLTDWRQYLGLDPAPRRVFYVRDRVFYVP